MSAPPFLSFDVSTLQPIPCPVGLADPTATTSSTSAAGVSTGLSPVSEAVELARLRLENVQLHRKLFQKQQQIERLTQHVNRLARALGGHSKKRPQETHP